MFKTKGCIVKEYKLIDIEEFFKYNYYNSPQELIDLSVHSQNPVGAENIRQIMTNLVKEFS